MTTPPGNWNLFLIDFVCLCSKEQDSERAWKGIEDKEKKGLEDDEGFDTTISKSLSINSLLEDKPVSSSLDLTLVSLYSMTVISKWWAIKEWWIRG